MSKIRFIGINAGGKPGVIRDIDPDDVRKCPHVILVPEHYREDGTCRCDDPTHTIMAEWGYEWDGDTWISSTGPEAA